VTGVIVTGLAVGVLAGAAPARAADPLAALLGMEAAYARVADYTARFVRQERIGGALRPREEALIKFKRPDWLYLRWTAGPPRGREILFVGGRDGGRILVHQPGLVSGLFTLVMAPDHPRVLKESRHPVTDAGIGRLIELILADARRGLERGELTLLERDEANGQAPRVRRIEGILPRDPGRGYYAWRVLVSIDLQSGLPVGARLFDWEERLVADYAYLDLRLNPGLTERDFDPANPDYGFPRWRLHR
jgi:hypothetical protein